MLEEAVFILSKEEEKITRWKYKSPRSQTTEKTQKLTENQDLKQQRKVSTLSNAQKYTKPRKREKENFERHRWKHIIQKNI